MTKKYFIFFLVLFISVSLFSEVRVEVGKAVKKEVTKKYEFSGFFSIEKSVNVFPKIRGVLTKLNLKESDKVRKGDLIGFIKRDDPGYKFKPLKLISPASGVIIKINAYEGTRVNPQSPILTIASYNPIILNVELPSLFFYKIKKGEKVDVKVEGIDKIFNSVVYTKINPGNPKLKTGILKVRVINKNFELVPNTTGKVIIKDKKELKILAPADSVFSSVDGYYVWIVKDGKAYKREVKVGDLYGRYFEIIEGLSGNETLIIFGAEKLKNGDKVIFQGE